MQNPKVRFVDASEDAFLKCPTVSPDTGFAGTSLTPTGGNGSDGGDGRSMPLAGSSEAGESALIAGTCP